MNRNNDEYNKLISRIRSINPSIPDGEGMTNKIMSSINSIDLNKKGNKYILWIRIISGMAACLVASVMIAGIYGDNVRNDYYHNMIPETINIKTECSTGNMLETYRCFIRENNIGHADNMKRYIEHYK